MDVRFIATTSSKLSQLSVVDGQLIYLTDLNATYYDMGSSRRLISGVRIVPSLPSTSVAQEGVLYSVVNVQGQLDASIWDSSANVYRSLSASMATTSTLGVVKPDGQTIFIDANGVISSHRPVTSLPASSVTYDNSVSGLSSTEVQGAVTEVSSIAGNAVASATSAMNAAEVASVSAANASTAAAAASTAAATASAQAAAASSVVQSYEARLQAVEAIASRLEAVEAIAAIALTTEGPTTASGT